MVTGRRSRLLLADDSVTIQKVVELTFSDEGLEVIAVGDGQQALEKLEESAPDIVLADVFMPGLSGYEICEHIKRSERFRHIPVLLLVGSFEPFDEEEARRVGADDYLTKPFQSIRQLIGKVGGLLSGKRSSSEEETTRRLTPTPEMQQQEARVEQDFLERSTADTAPLPSYQKASAAARETSFADISMDDEMIEATPATTYGNAQHPAESVYAKQTTQYSAADLKEAGISDTMPSESASETQEEFGNQFSRTITGEDEDAPASTQPQAETTRSDSFAASDDALLDLGETEPPASFSEADEFILDLQDEEAPAPRAAASESSFAETLPSMPWAAPASSSAQQVTESAPPQAQEFVEAEVVGEEQAAEFAPVEAQAEAVAEDETPAMQFTNQQTFDMQSAPTERLPHDFHFGGTTSPASPTDESEQSSATTTSGAGQITLDQLSPEVIDAIARRAVEQLSEQVVERIAWEVVPELAELLIKRRLEEKQ